MATNHEIARIFIEIADLLEIKGENRFKVRAYRMAANKIQESSELLEKMAEKETLIKMEGIGKALAEKILEIIQSGDCELHRKLLTEIPVSLLGLLRIEGLGPKRTATLYQELNVTDIATLKEAAEQGKIEKLKGFGPKICRNILKGIESLAASGQEQRFLLDEVLPVAYHLVSRLQEIPGIEQVEVAGSLRRWKETVKDIDIIVTGAPEKSLAVMDAFTSDPEVQEIVQKGETKSSVKLHMGIHVDLRFVPPDCFGAAMQYFTGSKEHNIALRTYAKDKGFKTSEYGLFKLDDQQETKVAGPDEEEFYQALGMQYIEPEMRENTGELDLALQGRLPCLLNLDDIRGDLHMHTQESDGTNSLTEMIEFVRQFQYEYIGITEHSHSLRVARGLDEDQLLRWIDTIHRTQANYPDMRLLAGIEVDILKDGSLDLKDEALQQCDIVIASIHSYFHMPQAEMTKRIIDGISNPHVNILGHPSGRLIYEREPLSIDFNQVFATAAKQKVAMEINCHPQRLDLKDTLIRTALDYGCKFCINTDSHAAVQFQHMPLGVHMARRGWCRKEDCVNTLPFAEFQKFLHKELY